MQRSVFSACSKLQDVNPSVLRNSRDHCHSTSRWGARVGIGGDVNADQCAGSGKATRASAENRKEEGCSPYDLLSKIPWMLSETNWREPCFSVTCRQKSNIAGILEKGRIWTLRLSCKLTNLLLISHSTKTKWFVPLATINIPAAFQAIQQSTWWHVWLVSNWIGQDH